MLIALLAVLPTVVLTALPAVLPTVVASAPQAVASTALPTVPEAVFHLLPEVEVSAPMVAEALALTVAAPVAVDEEDRGFKFHVSCFMFQV